jgi:hypothetical protein
MNCRQCGLPTFDTDLCSACAAEAKTTECAGCGIQTQNHYCDCCQTMWNAVAAQRGLVEAQHEFDCENVTRIREKARLLGVDVEDEKLQ